MMPNASGAVTANPFEEPESRISEYTAQEIATLQARLDRKLGPEYISSRPGAGGQRVHYLAADKCINLANEVFGFNGWSSSIQTIQIDFDIGYGHIENCKGKAAAFEKAKKEGTTDALKRALRNFGNVLGNCVYDKDYVSKVTKVKATPAKWDVDDLHRHPDFAPVKKEPPPPRRLLEDDDLPPPRPSGPANSGHSGSNANFDGDGEFGSDLFDEADFVVGNTGNPDEITIEPDVQRQPPTPMNNPAPNGPAPGRFNSAAVTPSKPERWTPGGATGRPVPPNGRPNLSAMPDQSAAQRRPGPGPGQAQNIPNARPSVPPIAQGNAAQPPIKRESAAGANQDMQPPQSTPSAGFYSARAVDLLRDNPNNVPSAAPQFDPHADSPSIRKTAGVDHTKSVPISKPMLASASPATNNSRDFVNPATDMQRRLGAPGAGGGAGSPMSRGPSTSSYRPLTRPNIDPKNVPNNAAAINRGSVPPQNLNGKRPPLNDVTNANTSPDAQPTGPVAGPNDPKRPRFADGDSSGPPQLPQHPPPQ
ncbi:hypothetical protein NUU61_009829 [Penicillium alfredii]|uniref:RAD52 DNA repair protein RADC n=1 Tax=Penicillium alfredii TaxID=1506179 RepID=A0A9W9EH09_9EURO|nr:uncharacterized protein NUU61_009829 [Penicillium alfredii]KAJ5081565.1 hypothetical protein NUU61_009829 [Penicillium alfredii]